MSSHDPRPKTGGPQDAERADLDRSHDSNSRGEHRYPDRSQTAPEQKSREERDELKRRLERRPPQS
jgi:hypothetical protein